MTEIIFGNVCSLGACISDSISGTRKTKKSILIFQSISQVFYLSSSLFFKAYSTATQNVVSIFRNLYGAFDKHNKVLDWIFVLLPLALGIYYNNQGLLGIVPVVANLEYSLALLFFSKNPTTLKIAFFICLVMFIFFNFMILNIVGGIACTVSAVSTGISIYQELKENKNIKQNRG